jgi:hypothetical protein
MLGRMARRFPTGELTRIFALILALVFVLMMRQGCANGVAGWFNVFAPPPETGAKDAGG